MAYIIKPGGPVAKSAGSLLGTAELDRAKDTLILARKGSAHCKRLWNDFAQESPALARIVVKWAEAERAGRVAANRAVDDTLVASEALLTKSMGSGQCLNCGARLKKKWPKCPACGRRNKFHQAKAGDMKRNKARKMRKAVTKASRTAVLTKAAGTGVVVKSRSAAIKAMLAEDLNHCDPARREAARVALARLA